MSESANKAVFLSYASQDAEAAKRICEALRAAGVEVWFDQSELRGGDSWDAKIRGQIASCALFVPIISASTQARLEGYFRLEWKLAAQRTHTMADAKPFLLPAVIDATRDTDAHVPAEFKAVQWTRLSGGETPEKFCARVKTLLDGGPSSREAASAAPAAPASRELGPPRNPARAWWLGSAAFAIVVAIAAALFVSKKFERPVAAPAQPVTATPPPASQPAAPTATAAPDKSVAVLAFANLSDDKGNEYFSDGISEELLNVLAKIPNLKVSARTSAFYFKGKEVPIPEIAKQLGVAYVVEGSVRKAGDKVRITAQLIKAADGFHVWSDTFTRDLKDIFAVQDEIAGLIAKNLELKMGMVAARPTIDLEAYQEYLTGRAAAAKASNADLRAAVGHFAKAVEIEPKFTAAWVQLASAHTQLGRWGGASTLKSWTEARAAINRALALEPDSPDALVALGWILRTGEWNWRGAEQAFRRALELRPNHPDTLSAAAVLLFNVGRKEEALRLGRQAVQSDPLNAATQIDLSLVFYFSQEWAEQEKLARRAIELAPTGVGYRGLLAYGLAGQHRFVEGEFEARLETDDVTRLSALGILAAQQAQGEAARGHRRQLEEISRARGDTADLQLGIADISALIGDKDQAFAALEKTVSTRDPAVAWFRNDFCLRSLHSDLRWDALLRKVGLADDQLK